MESAYREWLGRHQTAIERAEMNCLARTLRTYGILHRDALRDVCGAQKWHEGGFDLALHAGIEAGVIERLPGEFYRAI